MELCQRLLVWCSALLLLVIADVYRLPLPADLDLRRCHRAVSVLCAAQVVSDDIDHAAIAIRTELDKLMHPDVTSIQGARIALREPIQAFYSKRGFARPGGTHTMPNNCAGLWLRVTRMGSIRRTITFRCSRSCRSKCSNQTRLPSCARNMTSYSRKSYCGWRITCRSARSIRKCSTRNGTTVERAMSQTLQNRRPYRSLLALEPSFSSGSSGS